MGDHGTVIMGVVSQFQGFVPIPLFDTGVDWDYSSLGLTGPSLEFNQDSFGPIFKTNATQVHANIATLNEAIGIQAAVGIGGDQFSDAAILTLNPGGSGGGNAGGLSWFDDTLWCIGGTYPFDPLEDKFGAYWFWKAMGRLPGEYSGYNPWQSTLGFDDTSGSRNYVTGIQPCNYTPTNAKKPIASAQAAWTNNNNSGMWSDVLVGDGGSLTFVAQILPNFLRENIQVCNQRLAIGEFQDASKLADNVMWFGTGSSVAPAPNCQVLYYNGNKFNVDAPYDLEDLNLDNTFLDAFFQSTVTPAAMFIYYSGFLAVVNTAGAGPSGTPAELLLFNPKMDQYWIIQFQPQDEKSQTLLNHDANWQVSIDIEGIFWLGTSYPTFHTQLSYSFSPNQYGLSLLYAGQLNPFSLPCYNTCVPVPLIG